VLPGALTAALAEAQVGGGWLRATGILEDVELRVYDGSSGVLGEARRIPGKVDAVSIEGGVGVARGEPCASLRAVLVREADGGVQTLAGEIVSARVVALEAHVVAFDDLPLPRALDASGFWMFTAEGADPAAAASTAAAATPVGPARTASPGWASAAAVSADTSEREPPRRGQPPAPAGQGASAPMPQRIQRPQAADDDSVMPETGDHVEHFAFGPGEVLKSYGDRLHIRVEKDGRVREIALEMLKVTALDLESAPRRFRLHRKL